MTIFVAFYNLFMIPVHMEVHSKYHLSMVDSFLIRSGVYHTGQIRVVRVVRDGKNLPYFLINAMEISNSKNENVHFSHFKPKLKAH